jgi:ketosteroid isomerase-like protein
MENNQALIHTFYTAFQNKDYRTMQACYADNATFSDPAFGQLDAAQVRAMWQMLLTRSTGLALTFSDIQAQGNTGSANWVAEYTFTTTNRKVTNRIHAQFVFEQGKILQHTDQFNFYTWSKQAFGFTGWLLGWTSFFHQKVQRTAKGSLLSFMKKLA